MGKYFGTDGFRGEAGITLTADHAYKVGRFLGWYYNALRERNGDTNPARIVIGKDTRQSGDMLEAALTAGLCSVGADVESLGVVPTPAVAYLVRKYNADAGVVISASHNPMEFNGIKIFAGTGYKLPDEVENEIEAYIDNQCAGLKLATGDDVGRVTYRADGIKDYADHLYESINGDLSGLNVCIDCANGASAAVARQLFPRLGAKCTFIGVEPDGKNINAGVGSTHLDNLEKAVVEGGFDCGIAFDGDADRCLMVDEAGEEIDGDQVIAACGLALKEAGELVGGAIVGTVMSNLGLHRFCKEHGIGLFCTSVGDRNVLEKMEECGYVIGGEQSGHTIFRRYATTGDGQLTALQFLDLLCRSGKKASELVGECKRYPQVLINVPVADKAKKEAVLSAPALQSAVAEQEEKLAGNGRVLVRPSGTEALIRVMVEAQTEPVARETAELLANVIKNHGS